MKKILITLFALTFSLSGFSQSFSVDNKSLSVPKYANQTAISTAISAPTTGMLVYDNSLNQYAYWNGSAWMNFPAASSAPVLWGVNSANRIASNAGYVAGIEVNRITSLTNNNTLSSALLNAEGNGTTFLKFGIGGSAHSVSQEAVAGFTVGASSINWRYNDNANPQVSTHLFGYSGNTFNVTGGLTTTGNTTINGTSTVTQASALRGKTTIGTISTGGNGLEIQSASTTVASPDIYLKSPNNVIRYGNTSGNAGMFQSVINSATPSSASMSFVHLDNAAIPVQSMMMTLDGEGDLTAFGFTKLGGSAADVPAIKTRLLTGNMPNAATTILNVPHGLTASKIIEVKVLITGFNNLTVSDNFTPTATSGGTTYGYLFNTSFDATNIYITRNVSTTSSSNGIVTAGGVTASYKIFITYTP